MAPANSKDLSGSISTQPRLPFEGYLECALAAGDYVRDIAEESRALRRLASQPRAVPQVDASGITVPAYSRVVFDQVGYCLDPGVPAPTHGELLRLVPTSSLIAPELLDIYKAVLQKIAQPGQIGQVYRQHMQEIVWALRTAGDPNSTRIQWMSQQAVS
ncbi:MAG: hypothetical protein N2690_10820, partial [Rhodocyclaceae bacterium]|nr:hypothetical protein [Rhodocyclaceae bacterium]